MQAMRDGHLCVMGGVKHVYFVAETQGAMSSMDLREIEKTKIKCARKLFEEMNRPFTPENLKSDVVDGFWEVDRGC